MPFLEVIVVMTPSVFDPSLGQAWEVTEGAGEPS